MNHCISRTGTDGKKIKYAYDRNGAVIVERTGNSTRSYIYANGVIAGFVDIDGEKSETRRYCVTNHQGSVEKIVDGKGFVLWASCYTAFGIKEGETVNKIEFTGRFTGKDMDCETGLTYHWNRWRSEEGYNWISEDSARDGTNWYGDAGQNPLKFVDKTGLSTIIDENSGTIIAGIDDNDYGVYSVPTLNGERIEGPANKVGFTTRPDFAINPPERIEDRNEDTTKEKTDGYLFLLYRNDMGVNRTLRELGLLEKVKNAVDNNPKLTKNHGTVKQRFINQLKDIKEPKDAWFENSYSFLSEKFAIGTATVYGELDGIVFKNKDGSTHIEGVINYRFDDNFTDPYDLTNKIPGEWNPDGKPYKISDTWKRNINGDY